MLVLVLGIAVIVLVWLSFQKKIESFQAINAPFRYILISSPTTVNISQLRIVSNEFDLTLHDPNIKFEGEKTDLQFDLRNDELVDKIIYNGKPSQGMTMSLYSSTGSKVGETITLTTDEEQEFDLKTGNSTGNGGKLVSNGLLVRADGNNQESEIGSKNAITASAINGKSGEASIWMGYDPQADFGYINAARHGAVRPINFQTRGGNSGGAGVGVGVNGDPRAKFHVQGDTLLEGATTVDGDFYSHGLKVSRNWTGYPDNSTTQSEISNDTNGFKQLMIVGNKSGGGERRVGIWDTLNVNGKLNISGDTRANGSFIPKYSHSPYVDAGGSDITHLNNSSYADCQTACDVRPDCRGFNFQAAEFPNGNGQCWIKNNVVNKTNTPDWHLFSKNF